MHFEDTPWHNGQLRPLLATCPIFSYKKILAPRPTRKQSNLMNDDAILNSSFEPSFANFSFSPVSHCTGFLTPQNNPMTIEKEYLIAPQPIRIRVSFYKWNNRSTKRNDRSTKRTIGQLFNLLNLIKSHAENRNS